MKELLFVLEQLYLQELNEFKKLYKMKKNKVNKHKSKKMRKKERKQHNAPKSDIDANSVTNESSSAKNDDSLNKFPILTETDQSFAKIKNYFEESFKIENPQEFLLRNPQDKSYFYVSECLPLDNQKVLDKCFEQAGRNKEFTLRNINELEITLQDMIRIFFVISDRINPEKKFLSWPEKKKYLLERIMGYWYVVDDQELQNWLLGMMSNLADKEKRKQLSSHLSDTNCSIGEGSNYEDFLKDYSYEKMNREKVTSSLNFRNMLIRRVFCDVNDLVNLDNCSICRQLYFLMERCLDVSVNGFGKMGSKMLEVFVFYTIKYFKAKQQLKSLELTAMGPEELLEKEKVSGEADFCKFVIGFCFRNCLHFSFKFQDCENLVDFFSLVNNILGF